MSPFGSGAVGWGSGPGATQEYRLFLSHYSGSLSGLSISGGKAPGEEVCRRLCPRGFILRRRVHFQKTGPGLLESF